MADLAQAIAELDEQIMDKLNWVQQHKTGDANEDLFLEQSFITYGAMAKSFMQMKELGNLTMMELAALEMSLELWKTLLSKISGQLVDG